jgi:hypothetical protein
MKDFMNLIQLYFYNSANIFFNTVVVIIAKLFGNIDSYKEFYCSSIHAGFEEELESALLNDDKIKIDECEEIIYISIAHNTLPLIMFPSIRGEVFDKCSSSIIRKFRWKYSVR